MTASALSKVSPVYFKLSVMFYTVGVVYDSRAHMSDSFHGGPSVLQVFAPPLYLIDELRSLISKRLPSTEGTP